MRALVQRISRASIEVDGKVVARMDRGLLAYVGVQRGDAHDDVDFLAGKIRYLRVFQDAEGKLNRDVAEAGGAVLIVSNFTLLGDAAKGRRPAFTDAADPETALRLYNQLCQRLESLELEVHRGRFRETMAVFAVNDGPINLLLDSRVRKTTAKNLPGGSRDARGQVF